MARKATTQQIELLLNFLSENRNLISGKLSNSFTVKDRQQLWEKATELLNADGFGPKKSAEKWRKTWNDFKNNIKQKVMEKSKHLKGTGGGPAMELNLTPTEERVMGMIGWVYTQGHGNIESSIMSISENKENTEEQEVQSPLLHISNCISLTDNIEETVQPSELHSNQECSSSSIQPHGKKRKRDDECQSMLAAKQLMKIEERKAEALEQIAKAKKEKNEIMKDIAKSFYEISSTLKCLIETDICTNKIFIK